jgi:hypothetical protein
LHNLLLLIHDINNGTLSSVPAFSYESPYLDRYVHYLDACDWPQYGHDD